MGRLDHLQDAPQLHRAPGHAQLGPQLWHHIRDRARRLPVLHARHGQGSPDVSSQVSLNHYKYLQRGHQMTCPIRKLTI